MEVAIVTGSSGLVGSEEFFCGKFDQLGGTTRISRGNLETASI